VRECVLQDVVTGLTLCAVNPQIWAMSLPGGTHQNETRVDLTPEMTVQDLAEQARVAWGVHTSTLLQAMRQISPLSDSLLHGANNVVSQ